MNINFYTKEISIQYCKTFFSKFKGLMFKKEKISTGICLVNTNSIHTFFMYQNIDIIMTDKLNNILYTFINVKPNRIIFPQKGVYYTYELPLNTINSKLK